MSYRRSVSVPSASPNRLQVYMKFILTIFFVLTVVFRVFFCQMGDEKLIESVRMYPVLYDWSNPKYMDTIFKSEIWKKIGEEIKTDGAACKSRWNNIRDNYRKSLKKNAGRSAKKIKMYKYSEQLSFLKKCSFDDLESISTIKSEEAQRDYDTQHTREENDDYLRPDVDIAGNLPHRTIETYEGRPKLGPPKSNTKRMVTKIRNQPRAASKLLISKYEKQAPQHPVDTFLASIATTLKTFSPYHLHFAKAEIFNAVQKYELKTIMGDIGNNTIPNSPFVSLGSPSMSTHSPTEVSHQFQLNTTDNIVEL